MSMRKPGQAVNAIRDAVWQDPNKAAEQIAEELKAQGFLFNGVAGVSSTRSSFLSHLTWLHQKGIYTAPMLARRLPAQQLRKKRKVDAFAKGQAVSKYAAAAPTGSVREIAPGPQCQPQYDFPGHRLTQGTPP
jgi:hypothetical protein